MLKAIETVYNGYRFRSRLEARWACFFDELGIRYEYESDGFDLGGTWYLPDFWLPELKKFVEIKPEKPSLAETKKCCELAKASKSECMLIFGQPWMYESMMERKCGCCELGYEWEYRFYLLEGNELDPYSLEAYPWETKEVVMSKQIIIPGLDSLERNVFAECRRCPVIGYLTLNEETCPLTQGWGSFCGCTDKQPYAPTHRLMAAYTAARQARFEHEDRTRLKRGIDTNLERIRRLQQRDLGK